jgi:hypothetical protein
MFGQFSPDVDEIKRTDGYDEYAGAQMTFDLGGETVYAEWFSNAQKGMMATQSVPATLYTRRYTVRLMDGSEQELAANQIAENLYAPVKEHGQ